MDFKRKISYRIYILVGLCLIFVGEARSQEVALKNNLLFDAIGSLSLGVEKTIKPRATCEAYFALRPWSRNGDVTHRHWLLQGEYKLWNCQKYNGGYWSVFLNGGEYNIGGISLPFGLFSTLKSHRYEGWLAGVGISYGYHLMLEKHWNLEASIGVGYEYLKYSEYGCKVCNNKLKDDVLHYFGINKLSVGVTYLF